MTTPHAPERTLILGIGNLVLCDEGFGIHVVRHIVDRLADRIPPGVDVLDGGTAGLHLMGTLAAYDRVIVVDAALDSNPAGTLRTLRPVFGEYPPLVTAHEIGLKDTLEALALTDRVPDVTLLVCSVNRYTSLGTELTPPVADAVGRAATEALRLASQTAT